MAASVRPRVLFPSVPAEGESLIGFAYRTACDNVHGTLAPILAAAGYPHHAHFDVSVARPELLPRLAEVLGVTEAEAVTRAHAPLEDATAWGGERVGFFGAPVWKYDLDFRRRRIAPTSLRARPVHRATWTHALVPWCTESGEALIDGCPSCGRALRWHRAVGVAACDRCKADLRDFPSPGPSMKVRADADPFLDLLSPEPHLHEPAIAALHPDLRSLGRGATFELGWRLACALGAPAGTQPRGRQHGLPAEDITATILDASRLVAGWPTAFRNRLEQVGGQGHAAELTQTIERVRRDLHRRRAWPEIAGMVEKAMPDVFGRKGVKSRSVALAHAHGFVDGSGASRLLGLGSRKFAALHRADLVIPAFVTGNVNRFMTIEVAPLEEARQALADRIPRGTVKEMLGVTAGGVEQLACLGALRIIDNPLVRHTHAGVQISRASLDRLLAQLDRAASATMQDAAISVTHALRGVGGEKPFGPVIVAMTEGRLPFKLINGSGRPFLERAMVCGRDAARLAEFRFDNASYPNFKFESTITRKDAADVLNVAPPLMMKVLGAELAGAQAEGTLLIRSAVVHLAHERITGREVLIRWAGGGRRLPAQLRNGRCPDRLGPAGWHRETVERLMQSR